MTTSKRSRLAFSISLALLFSGWLLSASQALAVQPEPQCVCAECGKACGSGHTADCSSRPKS